MVNTRLNASAPRRGLAAGALLTAGAAAALTLGASRLQAQSPLYRSGAFVVTDTSVSQGAFRAVALSRDTIVSSYPRSARQIHFRFALNRQDDEGPSGTDRGLYIRPRAGRVISPVYTFGEFPAEPLPEPAAAAGGEDGLARVTLRVDLRPVLRAFARNGVYHPPQGPPIRRADFEGVYVIGDTPPLSWNAADLRPDGPARLTDPDGDSIYTVTLPVEAEYTRPRAADGQAIWARHADIAGFPQVHSPQRLPDALYRLALEELTQLVRPDGALSAGAKWPGVWTRDVSYSSVLALALVAPDAVRRSLLAKVDSLGRIIQDTGTGGSWPISTDRMTWALAAWELYAATGDQAWLRQAYGIVSRSAAADEATIFDPLTGLAHGESSFMDWREQSYPRWMDPRDIYESQVLSTNVVHYATYGILAKMARALGQPADAWSARAAGLRAAINKQLWRADLGRYAEFRYGRDFQSLSPRSETLGEALAVIYGVAGPARSRLLARGVPVVAFGAPSFWPYIPNLTPYHDDAVWPFVTAFWAWAAADAGNTAAVEHALASVYRPAALFLTNKENFVATTGHFEGTALTSDRQLWSVAGMLATDYRVLFGVRLEPDRLAFRPMVPRAYAGERTLTNLHYRGAILDVRERGFGDGVARMLLDGRPVAAAAIPATLTGHHTLELVLNGRWPATKLDLVENRFAPETPASLQLQGAELSWQPAAGAVRYRVYRDGRPLTSTTSPRLRLAPATGFAEYQVLSVDAGGLESFLSEPVRREPAGTVVMAPLPAQGLEREHTGFSGAGYLTLTEERNTSVAIPVHVPRAGVYAIDARYANGSGPINTEDKAAVRTLLVDGRRLGVLVLPQRGPDRWDDWGYSTMLRAQLAAGDHVLTIRYEPLNRNMNGRINRALLDHLRLTRLAGAGGD